MEDKGRYSKDDKSAEKDTFLTFICNRRTGEFCGRTAGSWAKILIFYVIFYACLAAFWAVMLLIFYQTIDENKPKWTLDESRIGSNPGLGYRPRPPKEKVESTLIWFKQGAESTYAHIVQDLTEYIDKVDRPNNTQSDDTTSACREDKVQKGDKFCPFNTKQIEELGSCTKEDKFGYAKGEPCVLIKLNRIFDWKPVSYKDVGLEVPQEVKNMPKYQEKDDDGFIRIICEGENPADKENLGELKYYPENGISFKYFPFQNKPGYVSPFVWVQFKTPGRGILLNIECKAYAGNIKHNRADREGTVHFELLVD